MLIAVSFNWKLENQSYHAKSKELFFKTIIKLKELSEWKVNNLKHITQNYRLLFQFGKSQNRLFKIKDFWINSSNTF